MNRLVGLIGLAISFACSVASAQERPSLRAAPPPEPDVLRALPPVPDAGAAAQETRDIAGRWTGGFDAAMQSLGKAGGTLTNIVTGKFDGLSKTIAITDASAALGAASAGDLRGAVSGVAAIAVGGNVTAGGAALFGEIGTVAGGAIGSFFPVIGNIAGSIVGGAVGTAAGGFIAAFGYDKYLKDYVAKGVTGIASIFDKAPLAEAMEAKRAFLWATMAPEERAQLQGFRPEEVTLLDFGTLPYVLVPKQSLPQAPAPGAQQQAALPPGGPSTVTGDIQIVVWTSDIPDYRVSATCRILAGAMQCQGSKTDPYLHMDYRFEGTITGSTAIGQFSETMDVRYQGNKCSHRYAITFQMRYDFDDGGRMRGTGSPGTQTLISNTCPDGRPASRATPAHTVVGEWKTRQ